MLAGGTARRMGMVNTIFEAACIIIVCFPLVQFVMGNDCCDGVGDRWVNIDASIALNLIASGQKKRKK